MRASARTVVSAPIETVWDVVSDPERALAFMSGVTRWEVDSDKRPGPRCALPDAHAGRLGRDRRPDRGRRVRGAPGFRLDIGDRDRPARPLAPAPRARRPHPGRVAPRLRRRRRRARPAGWPSGSPGPPSPRTCAAPAASSSGWSNTSSTRDQAAARRAARSADHPLRIAGERRPDRSGSLHGGDGQCRGTLPAADEAHPLAPRRLDADLRQRRARARAARLRPHRVADGASLGRSSTTVASTWAIVAPARRRARLRARSSASESAPA